MMKKIKTQDDVFMRKALRLASQGQGLTSPNPMVGAVIVKGGKVIGQGYHQKAGQAHAEVNAIKDARRSGKNCVGATLYVTLEPCSSFGKTPPCTDLIKRERFARVVIGCLDPDPRHQGAAVELLQASGIQVDTNCLEDQCLWINRIFLTNKILNRPYFIGKIALTKDGKISGQKGKWITTSASRRHAHHLRFLSDAVLVGSGTVLADDPSLTLRHGYGQKGKIQPWRVILDSRSRVSTESKLLSDKWQGRTLHLTAKSFGKLRAHATPEQIAQRLYGLGICSCLVEGGREVLESFLKARLIDEFYLYESGKVISHCADALDGSELRKSLMGAKDFRQSKMSLGKRPDRITHLIWSSSCGLRSMRSMTRRLRATVVPKKK